MGRSPRKGLRGLPPEASDFLSETALGLRLPPTRSCRRHEAAAGLMSQPQACRRREAAAGPFRHARILPRAGSICFSENVFVLGIANDKATFAIAVGSDERESITRRVDGDERDSAVVILARCHNTLPAVKVKNGISALTFTLILPSASLV